MKDIDGNLLDLLNGKLADFEQEIEDLLGKRDYLTGQLEAVQKRIEALNHKHRHIRDLLGPDENDVQF